MREFCFREVEVCVKLRQVLSQHLVHLGHILGLHWSHSSDGGLVRQLQQLLVSGHGHVRWQGREPNVDQFLWVQISMPVSCLCEGHGDNYSSCVDSLPHIFPVDSSRHFLNEDGREFFSSEFPVNTKEIDFSHLYLLSSNNHSDWNSRNKSEELFLLSSSYTELPVFVITRKSESPLKEWYLIVESEHCVIIFNIVLRQECVNFFSLFGIINIYI